MIEIDKSNGLREVTKRNVSPSLKILEIGSIQ